jgi:hypothetical protein
MAAVLEKSDDLGVIRRIPVLEHLPRTGGDPLPIDEVPVGLGFCHVLPRLPRRPGACKEYLFYFMTIVAATYQMSSDAVKVIGGRQDSKGCRPPNNPEVVM